MASEITVLHVDDDESLADLTATYLRREGLTVTIATSVDDGLDALDDSDGDIDCVVSDYQMPGRDGLEFLDAVRASHSDLPFILFTGKGSEEIASDAISAGVTDYLQKETGTNQYAVLANTVRNAVERSRAETALSEERALTEFALDAIEDLFYVFDADGTVLRWNDRLPEVTGYTDAELGSLDAFDIFADEDAERVRAISRQALTGERGTFEADLVTREGGRIPHEWTCAAVTADDGTALGLCLVAREFADNDQTAVTFDELLARMTDAFFALDDDWRFTYVNERAAQLLDRERGDLLGTCIWAEFPEADGSVFSEQYRRAMETQEVVNFQEEFPPFDAWFEVTAYPSPTGLSVYFRDVTETKAQRSRLERQATTLHELYRIVADADLSFEEKVSALLAVGEEAIGVECSALARVDGSEYELTVASGHADLETGQRLPIAETYCERTVAAQKRTEFGDICEDAPDLAARGGYTELGIECYVGTPVAAGDDLYGTLCFFDREAIDDPFHDWDLSLVDLLGELVGYELERKERERELKRQRNRLEEFASVVSHDIRNPLTTAVGNLELARETGDSDHFEKVVEAHDRIESIVEEVLTLARQGEVVDETESVRLESVVRRAWSTLDATAATLDVAAPLDAVEADDERLQALFENLFRNAAEHAGPDVTVSVGPLSDADGFYVEDDGHGLSADERDAVFEHGYTTAADGTGYGLSIVRRVAEAHGWTVSAGESSGGGARFEVRF